MARSPLPDIKPEKLLIKLLTQEARATAWTWNVHNGEFHIAPYYQQLFGLSATKHFAPENPVKLLEPYLTEEQLENLKKGFRELKETEHSQEQQWLLTVNGEKKLIVLKAKSVFKEGKVFRLEGFLKEVENLDQARLQKLAANVIEGNSKPVLVINHKFSIIHVNPATCQSLQYSVEDMVGKMQVFNVDIENTLFQWENHLKKLSSQKKVIFETSFQRADNTIYPVKIIAYHFEDSEGALICLVAIDITQRRMEVSKLQPALLQQQLLSNQLQAEKLYLQEELGKNYKFKNIISVSKAYRLVLNQIKQVAGTSSTVLIEGETGTGKELIARAIHELSDRSERTMIKLNCANLPKDLIESELFGHEKGAFTGAIQQKKGRFELADRGTLFLDEIGEMPLSLQTRLLRVLQEGEFERLGGNEMLEVDVRIIAATNRKLKKLVDQGLFREDLYYRLHVFPINNIPLRERKEDIPVLAQHFLEKYCRKMNRSIKTISNKDLQRLERYDFPGNIRELENIIERSVILSNGPTLNLDYWQPDVQAERHNSTDFPTLEEIQRMHIIEALEVTKWRVSGEEGAAQLLGLKDQTLFSRMRKLGISRHED